MILDRKPPCRWFSLRRASETSHLSIFSDIACLEGEGTDEENPSMAWTIGSLEDILCETEVCGKQSQ